MPPRRTTLRLQEPELEVPMEPVEAAPVVVPVAAVPAKPARVKAPRATGERGLRYKTAMLKPGIGYKTR